MRILPSLLALSILLPTLAVAQPRRAPELSARASFTAYRDAECDSGWKTVGVRYVVGHAENPMVVEETVETNLCVSGEFQEGWVTAAGRRASRPAGAPLWRVRVKGDRADHDVGPDGVELYRIEAFGCCQQNNSAMYYRMEDGRPLLTSTNDAVMIGVDRFATALVGWHDADSAHPLPEAQADSTVIGALTLAAMDGRTRQRVLVRGPEGARQIGKLQVVVRSPDGVEERPGLELSGPAAEDITEVAVRADLMDGTRVEVPVLGGRLVIEQARLPAGVTLSPAR